jgi:glyoxylase-like metal-dependent hydrolase (beta-lactamase superfamily II)
VLLQGPPWLGLGTTALAAQSAALTPNSWSLTLRVLRTYHYKFSQVTGMHGRNEAVTSWFATRNLEPGIFLVSEPVHVNSFLIEGTSAAALIDTGLGIGDIRQAAEQLASHDVFALNTHYHFDHTGGNHLFPTRLIHEAGAPAIERPVDPDLYRRYSQFIGQLMETLPRFRDLDDRFFHFLTDETTPRPLPADFELSSWSYQPTHATRTLRDGDRVELGGRDLTVLHTPGHTPDCICLLDEKNGVLFGGDTINTGPIYAQLADSDVEAFAKSARRLADLASCVRVVYVPHFVRYAVDPLFLTEVADGFERLVAGEVDLHPAQDYIGYPVQEASFQRFSIFIATPDGAPAL